jgi:hypothetical protein
MKRHTEKGQLRREEVEALDDEEESEDVGTFQRADPSELATRRILKIKRLLECCVHEWCELRSRR